MHPALPPDTDAGYPRPAETPLPRNPWGYVLVVLLFGTMIVTATAASFSRAKSDPALALRPFERQLEYLVSVGANAPDGKGKKEPANIGGTLGETAQKGLAALAGSLADEPKTGPKAPPAALLRALVARERDRSPTPEDLALAAKIAPDPKAEPATAERKTDGKILGDERTKGAEDDAKALQRAAALVAEDRPAKAPNLSPDDPFPLRLAAAQARERAGLPRAEARKGLVAPGYVARLATMLGGGFLAFALAVVLWLTYLVLSGNRAITTRGLPSLPMLRAEGDRFVLRGALIFGGFLVLSTILAALPLPRAASLPLGLALYGGIAIYALRLPRDPKVPNLSRRGLRVDAREFGTRVLWGVGAAIANIPILLAVTLLSSRLVSAAPPPSHPATELLTGNPSLGAILLTAFLAVVCAPIWEETVFRGLFYQGFAGAFGGSTRAVVGAALLSSFLFAAIHPQGPAGWAGLMTIALMSCALLRKTGSLVPSMVMHATHNALTLAAALLAGPIMGHIRP